MVKIHVVVIQVVIKVAEQVTAPIFRIQVVCLPRVLVPLCWTTWCDNTMSQYWSHVNGCWT